jgi:hypothetical protein
MIATEIAWRMPTATAYATNSRKQDAQTPQRVIMMIQPLTTTVLASNWMSVEYAAVKA